MKIIISFLEGLIFALGLGIVAMTRGNLNNFRGVYADWDEGIKIV